MLAIYRTAFPDARYTIEALIGEGDIVAVLYSWTRTNRGDLGPVPATGRTVSSTGTMFCRLENGKVVEEWDIDDRLHVMEQLGLAPASVFTG